MGALPVLPESNRLLTRAAQSDALPDYLPARMSERVRLLPAAFLL
jgi:hypothetical protein